MREVAPGWFIHGKAAKRIEPSKARVERNLAWIAGYAAGKRDGQEEFLRLAEETDRRTRRLVDQTNTM